MLGVVIWCCHTTGRAILWCADHRDLAHFDARSAGMTPIRVNVGDLVEMSLRSEATVRRCVDLRLVEAGYMPEIADELRNQRPGPRAIAAA